MKVNKKYFRTQIDNDANSNIDVCRNDVRAWVES